MRRQRERTYITPTDIRFAALRTLKRSVTQKPEQYSEFSVFEKTEAVPATDTIRIMTYNVHSCIGMDGKTSPERIARVIGRHKPDIVALQELDMSRKRTGMEDQPRLIAKVLEMTYHFYPSIVVNMERYGNAVLSRYPMEIIRSGPLPVTIGRPRVEPRGVIWSVINVSGTKINFFNTHLGLFPSERTQQAKVLLGPQWMAHPACQGPVILCGDFNAFPNSQLYRNIKGVLRDAQGELDNCKPQATWFGHYPVGRIDHVFVSPEIKVTRVEVSRTGLDKLASDHLPLIVDIKFNTPAQR